MAVTPTIDACELAKERMVIKVEVKRLTEFRFRTWLTARLLMAATLVSPIPIEIKLTDA